MITQTSLRNPTMINKILEAVVSAQDMADNQGGHGKSYISNKDGDNIMRLDVFKPGIVNQFPNGGVVVYGAESRNITSIVEKALGTTFSTILN